MVVQNDQADPLCTQSSISMEQSQGKIGKMIKSKAKMMYHGDAKYDLVAQNKRYLE